MSNLNYFIWHASRQPIVAIFSCQRKYDFFFNTEKSTTTTINLSISTIKKNQSRSSVAQLHRTSSIFYLFDRIDGGSTNRGNLFGWRALHWMQLQDVCGTSGGPRIPSRLGPNSPSEKLKTTLFILLKVSFLTFRIFI